MQEIEYNGKKYKIVELYDIKVGDEIYFESTSTQSNYGGYWPVVGKTAGVIHVVFNENGYVRSLDVIESDVSFVIPIGEIR